MSSQNFQFSPAARLYCQNVAVVDEIKNSTAAKARKLYKESMALITEMRAEAYQTIATFGDLLLEELSLLPWEKEGLRLGKQSTYTVRSSIGQRVNVRWLEPIEAGETTRPGYIYVMLPIPEKIKLIDDDTKLRGSFEVLTNQRLCVHIGCSRGTSESQRKAVTGLAKNKSFGTFKSDEGVQSALWIPLNADDPIGPTVKKIADLLRAIYVFEYPRQEPG